MGYETQIKICKKCKQLTIMTGKIISTKCKCKTNK